MAFIRPGGAGSGASVDTPFFVDPGRMTTGDGAPSYTVAGTVAVATLDPATAESFVFNIARRELPSEWTTAAVTLLFAPNGAESGKVARFQLDVTRLDVGDAYNGDVTLGTSVDASVGAVTRVVQEVQLATAVTLPSTDDGVLGCKVWRKAADAADTHLSDMWVFGVRFSKAS